MTRIVMKGLDLLGEACLLLHPRMILSNKHTYYRNDSFNNNNNEDGDELYTSPVYIIDMQPKRQEKVVVVLPRI